MVAASKRERTIRSIISVSFLDNLNTIIPFHTKTFLDACRTSEEREEIEILVDALTLVLDFFNEANQCLSAMFFEVEVLEFYRQKPKFTAIFNCLQDSSAILENFMTVLERLKIDDGSGICLNPLTTLTPSTTNGPSLSRTILQKTTTSMETNILMSFANRIETAITEWKGSHKLAVDVRARFKIAAEWSEFNDVILNEIDTEMNACQEMLEKYPVTNDAVLEDTSSRSSSLKVFHIHLVQNKLKLLKASLEFIPSRFDILEFKLQDHFPHAINDLKSRYETMHQRLEALSLNVSAVITEFGSDSWFKVLQSICMEVNELLAVTEQTIDENISRVKQLSSCFEILDKASNDNLLVSPLIEQKHDLQLRWSGICKKTSTLQRVASASSIATLSRTHIKKPSVRHTKHVPTHSYSSSINETNNSPSNSLFSRSASNDLASPQISPPVSPPALITFQKAPILGSRDSSDIEHHEHAKEPASGNNRLKRLYHPTILKVTSLPSLSVVEEQNPKSSGSVLSKAKSSDLYSSESMLSKWQKDLTKEKPLLCLQSSPLNSLDSLNADPSMHILPSPIQKQPQQVKNDDNIVSIPSVKLSIFESDSSSDSEGSHKLHVEENYIKSVYTPEPKSPRYKVRLKAVIDTTPAPTTQVDSTPVLAKHCEPVSPVTRKHSIRALKKTIEPESNLLMKWNKGLKLRLSDRMSFGSFLDGIHDGYQKLGVTINAPLTPEPDQDQSQHSESIQTALILTPPPEPVRQNELNEDISESLFNTPNSEFNVYENESKSKSEPVHVKQRKLVVKHHTIASPSPPVSEQVSQKAPSPATSLRRGVSDSSLHHKPADTSKLRRGRSDASLRTSIRHRDSEDIHPALLVRGLTRNPGAVSMKSFTTLESTHEDLIRNRFWDLNRLDTRKVLTNIENREREMSNPLLFETIPAMQRISKKELRAIQKENMKLSRRKEKEMMAKKKEKSSKKDRRGREIVIPEEPVSPTTKRTRAFGRYGLKLIT